MHTTAIQPTPSASVIRFRHDPLELKNLGGIRHSVDHQSTTCGEGGFPPAPCISHHRWRESLDLIARYVAVSKCRVRANDQIYTCGQPFKTLNLINAGLFKILSLAPDGRERSADFFFEGDWLGFDGLATGQHACSTISLDIGEIWTVQYDSLMLAAAQEPELLRHVLGAVGGQLARNRDITMSIGTLSAEARVADFLLMWANALAERGRRTDKINIYLSRSDIGDFLGIRLESVSRSLTKLAQSGIIAFNGRGRRRDISILNMNALGCFVQRDAQSLAERSAPGPELPHRTLSASGLPAIF